jgi:FKBP-type peptidyl-prolyl cis-trans isomerase
MRVRSGLVLVMLSAAALATACERAPRGGAPPADDAAAGAVVTASGLRYEDLERGAGAEATAGRIAVVHYTGWLADGRKFASSRDRGSALQFRVGEGKVIEGWDEGMAGMRVGGVRRLTIPPALGYGAAGADDVVPPNATLILEVELLDVR